MNIEILSELVGYDVESFSDESLNLINMEVVREVAAGEKTDDIANGTSSGGAPVGFSPNELQLNIEPQATQVLTATVKAYASKSDTSETDTVYEDIPYWYKIVITNAEAAATTLVSATFTAKMYVTFNVLETSYTVSDAPTVKGENIEVEETLVRLGEKVTGGISIPATNGTITLWVRATASVTP